MTEALVAAYPIEGRHDLPHAVDRPTIVALFLVGSAEVEVRQRVQDAIPANLRLMHTAVFLEASHHRPSVMPGPLVPTRELLAELFFERGHLQQAQQEFETQLHREPQRLNALYGAALTAELAGDLAKAASFYEDLLALGSEGASDQLQFAQARAFLANIALER